MLFKLKSLTEDGDAEVREEGSPGGKVGIGGVDG